MANLKNWQVGDKIGGRYRILQILGGPGKSGMGIVYICVEDPLTWLSVPLAAKTFQDKYLRDSSAIDRFKWEAEAWVRLGKHHNIVQAYFVEIIEGRPYIFTEFVGGDKRYGTDLGSWITKKGLQKNGGLDLPLILNFSIQFCHGMMHAENKFREMGTTFVHRDIKPQNIFIRYGRVVKVTDFGLVKASVDMKEDIPPEILGDAIHQRLGLSKFGLVVGTPPYMSPELCRGQREVDIRSDIYAFGCVLYEMLTGKLVFSARTPEEFIYHHLHTKPESLGIHKEIDKVTLRCLEKAAADRYRDFAELEMVLAGIYFGMTGERIEVPTGEKFGAVDLANKGISLDNLGMAQEAIANLKEALRIDPSLAFAHYNLGHCYRHIGNLDLAIAEFKKAILNNPKDADAFNDLGACYRAQGKLDSAISEFKEALQIDSNHAGAHYNLGVTLKDLKQPDLAIAQLKEALRIDPNLVEARHALGTELGLLNKAEEAAKELSKAVEIDPDHALAHHNLGLIYQSQHKLTQAIREFEEVIRIDRSNADAHNILGNIYADQGNSAKAANEYQEALRINPGFVDAHNNLGLAYVEMGKFEEAVRECLAALRLNPNIAEIHNNLGLAYDGLLRLEDSIREYQVSLSLKPNYAEAHYNLGNAYRKQNKLDQAVLEYKQALNINPNKSDTYNNLAITYLAQGKVELAISQFQQALRLNPGYIEAYANLGSAFESQGKPKEAIESFQHFLRLATPRHRDYVTQIEEKLRQLKQKVGEETGNAGGPQEKLNTTIAQCLQRLRNNPTDAEAHKNLGVAYKNQGKLEAAIDEYQEALRIRPDYPEAHYALGIAYKNVGKIDAAISEYNEAVRIRPGFPEALYNLGVTYKAQGNLRRALECFQNFIQVAAHQQSSQVKSAEENINQIKRKL